MIKQEVRTLGIAELKTVVNWAGAEGWNPGVNDAETFFAADSSGFFGGYINDELVASISAVRYHNQFAFIGLYIVLPDFRGNRLTKLLVDKALEVTQGVVTGIDGVVSMQKSYSNYGFRIANRNIRYEGSLQLLDGIQDLCVETESLDDVSAIDLESFGVARESFLKSWLKQDHAFTLMIDYGIGKRGFTTARKCTRGYKIGPLFADSPEIALQLLAGIRNRLGSTTQVSIDVPESNEEAIAIVRALGMSPTFETARMYRGVWEIPLNKVFGITSLELG